MAFRKTAIAVINVDNVVDNPKASMRDRENGTRPPVQVRKLVLPTISNSDQDAQSTKVTETALESADLTHE
jgi:hypothetical protein